MKLVLMNNKLRRLLGVYKSLVIPLVFAGFKGYFKVSYLVGLGQVETIRLC